MFTYLFFHGDQPTKKHAIWYAVMLCALVVTGVLAIIIVRLVVDHTEDRGILPAVNPNQTVFHPTLPQQSLSPTSSPEQHFMCGGIAGKKCPVGYTCKGKDTNPDASGSCEVDNVSPTPIPGMQSFIDFAKDDLTKRLEAEKSKITVFSVQKKEWSDGSMGCPEPGKMYTQSIVQGYEIVLSYQTVLYSYRGGMGNPFLCAHFNRE